MKKPTTMLLEANFDITQIGETLEWKFSRRDGDGNPVKGRYAGGIYFTVGEEMQVRVQAGSYTKFESFTVLDCCLITRPQITRIAPGTLAEYAEPSPFVDNKHLKVVGASINLPAKQFVAAKVEDPDPHYFKIAQLWANHLTVGESVGRWEISFAITVEITSGSGLTTKRVFVFDPEGEVGTGIVPPDLVLPYNDSNGVRVAFAPEGEVGTGIVPA